MRLPLTVIQTIMELVEKKWLDDHKNKFSNTMAELSRELKWSNLDWEYNEYYNTKYITTFRGHKQPDFFIPTDKDVPNPLYERLVKGDIYVKKY